MNYFLKGLFLLILLASAALYYLFAPTYATRLLYSGETISISRDQNNIPTIIAPSHLSFFYAIGRVHAEDRLFQMTFKLLVTQGRLSEFLGEKPLPMDKFMRELNLHGWGKQAA
jgi:penicillin amidase